MTEASYTAWDDKQYVWPPPEGWYQASDGKWWPEGYGPRPTAPAEAEAGSGDGSDPGDAADAEVGDDTTGGFDEDRAVDAASDARDDLGSSGLAFDAAAGTAAGAGSVLSGAADAVDDGVSGLADGAGSMVDQASEAAGGVGDRLSDAAGSATEGGLSGLSDAAGSMIDDGGAGSVLSGAADAADSGVSDWADGAGSVADRASDAVDGLADSTAEGATAIGDGVSDVTGVGGSDVQGVTDAVDEARSRLTGGLPDINDVMPTQEISSDSIAGLGAEAGDVAGEVAGDVADGAGAVLDDAVEAGGVDDFVPGDLPGADLGTENVTQVVPTDLSAAPTEFAPPPPGSGPGFARPPGEAPLSPLEHPTGPPNAEPGDLGPDGGPFTGFDAPAPSGPQAGLAPPGQLPPPGTDFGAPPGEVPGQPGVAAPGLGGEQQAYGGPLSPDLGLDSQTILSSKAKGRSKTWLWVLLGVLALVAIGAALFAALRGDDDAADGGETAAVGPGSFAEPHPRSTGVVVFYPDGDVDQRWVVEVLEPVRDVTPEIVSDASVAAPADGEVFGATRIRVRNESGVDGASLADLQFNAVNAAGTVIDRDGNPCSFSDQDLDYTASVALGTVVEGSVCWALPAEDLTGLRLGIESDKVSGRVHIDLN